MIKASVQIEMPDDLRDMLGPLNARIDATAMEIAQQVADDARNTAAFADKTGRLRKSIQARKSRYEGGGAIVVATAPHAALIEYGHALVVKGKAAGHVPAHPFLRPAKEKAVAAAVEKFRQAVAE